MSRKDNVQKLVIEELGGRGDGIVSENGKRIYVPYSAPGDEVDVKISGSKGRIRHIHKKSEYRVDPVCEHFTKCGGCSVQHIENGFYQDWKTGLLRTALKNNGLADIEINPIQLSPRESRRRTSLQVVGRGDGAIVIGYAEKNSHNLIDVRMCPILSPKISSFIQPLREFLSNRLEKGERMSVQITLGDNGLDVVFRGKGEIDLDFRMDIAGFAEQNDLARVSWFDTASKGGYMELLAERHKPYITIEGNKIFFPEGAFLQATEPGQNALIAEVLKAISGSKKVVDLFSGCGTFSIASAPHANVHAVENNESMLTALKQSANLMTGIKQVTTDLRDLFLRPLLPHELDQFDAVIIDPPRAGAHQQIAEIINSNISKVVMVSCNPLTFARDASELVKAGYVMSAVTPVDQFLYSSHLEMVASFTQA